MKTQSKEYGEFAKFYDAFYQNKDYYKEVEFLSEIFEKNNVKKLLDVGCGTGKHIWFLEKRGFDCEGLDASKEMVSLAKKRTKGNIILGDMRNFNLNKKFDAIICMFAVFNHVLSLRDAKISLRNFFNHLNYNGLLILDLHNPKKSGFKEDKIGNVSRKMIWKVETNKKIEKTMLEFKVPNNTIFDEHLMKIYSAEDIETLLKEVGFKKIKFFENYTMNHANNESKNLEVIAIK